MNKIAEKMNINQLEKKIFWFLAGVIGISSMLYVYLVNQTILNIVMRENVESEMVDLESKISELEFEYITLKNDINIDYAYSIGFVDVEKVKFASRKLSTQSLSVNSN